MGVIVKYVKFTNYTVRVKDTWPLFRNLKLPFIAHHLDFKVHRLLFNTPLLYNIYFNSLFPNT